MDVRAAEPERRHGRAPRHVARDPRTGGDIDAKRARVEVDPRIRALEVRERRQTPVREREAGLDQARDARRAAQVPDVRLHRADRAVAGARGAAAVHLRERGDFHRIAEPRAGAVRFHIADRVGRDARVEERRLDRRDLAFAARRDEALLARRVPVVARAGPEDHAVDRIAGRERVGERAQRDDADPAPEDRPVGVGVERAQPPGRREHSLDGGEIAAQAGQQDRGASRQRDPALAAPQAVHREVDRHQRRRARGHHAEARADEVEPVRDARGEEVHRVPDPHRKRESRMAARVDDAREDFLLVVALEPAEHPGDRPAAAGHHARALEGLPRALEEQPLRRVGELGLERRQVEEIRVEALDVVGRGQRAHEVRMRERLLRDAGPAQRGGRQARHAIAAFDEVAPEPGGRRRAGHAQRHADHGDRHRVRGFALRRGHFRGFVTAGSPGAGRGPRMPGDRAAGFLSILTDDTGGRTLGSTRFLA